MRNSATHPRNHPTSQERRPGILGAALGGSRRIVGGCRARHSLISFCWSCSFILLSGRLLRQLVCIISTIKLHFSRVSSGQILTDKVPFALCWQGISRPRCKKGRAFAPPPHLHFCWHVESQVQQEGSSDAGQVRSCGATDGVMCSLLCVTRI